MKRYSVLLMALLHSVTLILTQIRVKYGNTSFKVEVCVFNKVYLD